MSVNIISLKLKVLGLGVAVIIGGMTLLNTTNCGTGLTTDCQHNITDAQTIETSGGIKILDLIKNKS